MIVRGLQLSTLYTTGVVCVGGATFRNVRFDVVNKITDNVHCLLGQSIFYHPSLNNFTVNTVSKAISFIQAENGKTRVENTVSYRLTNHCSDQRVVTGTITADLKNETAEFKTVREKLEYLKRELDINLYHENPEHVAKFADILIKYRTVFDDGELGCYPEEIEIKTEGQPINIRPHPINEKYKKKR